ncbi:MAG: hypothetical protein ABI432_14190, partial [Flavobacteriales bacterium]
MDGNGEVYMAGQTYSPTSIASGGHQNTHGGGIFDAFLAKFEGEAPIDLGCATAAFAETEPNNSVGTSNPLTYATPMSGAMGVCSTTDNTSDFFGFTTTGQGVLRVEACLSNSGSIALDVTFRVVDSGGSTLGTFTLPAGADNAAVEGEFLFPCVGVGSYRIVVDNPSTTVCTHYAFSYTLLPPVFGNDPEPNDAIGATATPVAYDTYRDGRNNFDLESTYDYYSIVLPINGVLNIETEAEHAGAIASTMAVALLNSVGTVLQIWDVAVGTNGTPAPSNVSINCRSTVSPYYIRINAAVCGTSYRFKYTVTPPLFASDVEPNDAIPGSALASATYTEGNVQFDGDVFDYYNIVAPTNGVMSFEVQAEHAGATAGTLDLTLLNNFGSVIQTWTIDVGANGVPDTSTVSILCRSTVNAYNVRLSSATCGISYQLKYTMTAPYFAADVEPNNSTPGTSLAHNTYTEGHLSFDAENQYDHFNIVPPTNGVMTFEVQAEHADITAGTLVLALLNSAGASIQSWTLDAGATGIPVTNTVSITCRSTVNPYNIRLSSATCGISYRLKYTMTGPFFAPDAEPNNGPPGTALAPDTYTEGHVAFDAESTYDYYRIEQPANGRVNVEIQAEHTGAAPGTMTASLVTTAGAIVHTWTFPVGANSIPLTTAQSRTCLNGPTTYDLRVSSSTCGVSYKMKYTITPAVFSNDVEPNNSSGQAIILPETQTTQGQLNFPGADNYDVYRANLSSDGILNVLIEAEHAGLETNGTMTVVLFLSSGTVLQSWSAPIGADAVPISTVLKRSCLGNTVNYYVSVSTTLCGTSYRISYTTTPPGFANDPEPNNGTPGGGGPLVAHDTFQDGRLKFYPATDNDLFNIIPPINGVMRFEVHAEHAGTVADSMELRLYTSAGTTIQFWTIPVGPNGSPVTSVFTIPCRGSATDYDVRISSYGCGVSYSWKYTMIPAFFPTDLEPNNASPGGGGPLVAHDTYQDGQLEFYAQTGGDQYNIIPPTNGAMTFEVQAEHVGAAVGSMELRLYTSAGSTIQFWTIPVGANGVPVTSTFSIPCRGNTTDYDVRLTSATCGTSYRWKYTMSAPVFANDAEPNSTLGGSTEAPDTWYEGQISFNTTDADIYNLVPPYNGIMNIQVEAEHADASPGSVQMSLLTTSSSVIQTWSMTAGANSVPASTVVSIPCRSSTTDYDLRFTGVTCGVSYRWKYWITAPVFANDPEPNSSTSNAIAMNLNNASRTGQIGFDNQTDDDWYTFSHPGGPWSVTVSAEHADASAGSLTMTLRTQASTFITSFSVPAGGSSTPLTNTFTWPSLGVATYRLNLSDVTCGVSYRIHCNDTDGDGTCNGSDLCAGGPEPGTPCNDGNSATIN